MNIVCIGAHPDDCEVFAGGTSAKWSKAGHRVAFVSMTNGDLGHHEMGGGPLAKRRALEAARSAQRAGVEPLVLDYHDGELCPTLEARKAVVRIIREFSADMVITHRPNDYHPDHRYTGMLVQDAAFMVTVPHFCPNAPALKQNPVFLSMMDSFKRPVPFQADIAVAVDDIMDVKWDMLDAMESQVYEWLPWLEATPDPVPNDLTARRAWLRRTWDQFLRQPAREWRLVLEKWYGAEGASSVQYAEVFEVSEYGRQPGPDEIKDLFPF